MKQFNEFERLQQFFAEQDKTRLVNNWIDDPELLLQSIVTTFANEVELGDLDDEAAKQFGYLVYAELFAAFSSSAKESVHDEDYAA